MTPDMLDIAFIPALAVICAVTSFSDSREGKIRNFWILSGVIWAVAVYGGISLYRLHAPYITEELVLNTLFKESWARLLLHTGINSLFALVCGFLLFHFNLWSAGDAKLFFVLVLLLPLKYYFRHYIPFFPGFNLFLNTIVVTAFFVWADTAWKLVRFARASTEKNLWREMAGASLEQLKGAAGLMLLAGVVFSLLMCAIYIFRLETRISAMLTLLFMLGLIFFGGPLGRFLNEEPRRRRFRVFAVLFFSALLLSPMRGQFLHLALIMMVTFLTLYFMVGILPALAAKYGIGADDMPFAVWLSIGLASTMLIKGSFLYLAFF